MTAVGVPVGPDDMVTVDASDVEKGCPDHLKCGVGGAVKKEAASMPVVVAVVSDDIATIDAVGDGADYTAAVRQVQHILADAMQQFCPDIPFVTEYLLADRWYKGLDDQPTDESGRIVPYKNNCLANYR